MKDNKENNGQGERLRKLVMHFKITTRDLAKMIGRSENTLYKINCGRSPLTEKTATRICYWLEKNKSVHINESWLLTGDGEMINEKPTTTHKKDEDSTPTHIEKKNEEESEDYREKYYKLLERYIDLQDRYYKLKE